MISSFQNLLCPSMNHMTCDHYCDHVIWCVTAWSYHFNPNSSSKNRKIENKIKKENKNKKENKKKLSLLLSALTAGSYDHISHNISINNLTFKQRLYLNILLSTWIIGITNFFFFLFQWGAQSRKLAYRFLFRSIFFLSLFVKYQGSHKKPWRHYIQNIIKSFLLYCCIQC